jgi:ribosomal protein S27AE
MRYVPRVTRRQQFVRQESKHRRTRTADTTGFNFLHNIFPRIPKSQMITESRLVGIASRYRHHQMDDKAQLLKIDVDKRTTRGRVCPRCGGKIIPSRRAVYQNTGDPNAVFPLWQCERCGYEELVERAVKTGAKKH